jgi:hypothetical protein
MDGWMDFISPGGTGPKGPRHANYIRFVRILPRSRTRLKSTSMEAAEQGSGVTCGIPVGIVTRPTFVNSAFPGLGRRAPCRANVCQGANPLHLAPLLFEAGEALLGLCRLETRASCTRFFHQKRRIVLLALPGHPSRPKSSYSDFAPVPRTKEEVFLAAIRPAAPPQHFGDQQASEPAAAFRPNPAVAAAECSCQFLIVAAVAIRSHCYRKHSRQRVKRTDRRSYVC